MKKIFSRENITINDWYAIHTLMKTGINLNKALSILQNKTNHKMFKRIIVKLESGLKIKDCIEEYLSDDIKMNLLTFLKVLPFEKALALALEIYEYESDFKRNLQKELFYPCILLIFSISGLFLFDRFGLDGIFDILKSFNVNVLMFAIVRSIIRLFIYIIYFVLIIILCLFLVFKSEKRIVMGYIILSKYFRDSLLQIYFSQNFISYFEMCYKLGYKTKESLELLKSLKEKPIISFLAYHVDDYLLKGSTMDEALNLVYFDSKVASFIKLATISNDFDIILRRYVDICNENLKTKLKAITKGIQIGIYSIIGIIIIFIYQVLFLPMQTISQF